MHFLFPLIVVGIFLLIAYTRSGRVDKFPMTKREILFTSQLEPQMLISQITKGVGEFKVEDADAENGLVLLTTKPTFGTWGFFYPVEISAQPGGGSIVRIGIKSRVIQIGPLVTKWHKKCAAAVEHATGTELPTARVVGD